MTKDEFAKKIYKILPINKAEIFCEKLEHYKMELQKWNRKFNLTKLDTEDKIYGDYFFNSLSPYLNIQVFDDAKFLDIGSGSGVPGILIALFYENTHVTIIESNLKKCNFMSIIINLLNISNIEIINERAEIFANKKENLERFDFVTNRAFAHLKIFIEISFPILKLNGYLIAPKSKKYSNEINESKEIFEKFFISEISSPLIESFNIEIYNILIKKTQPTPPGFPRDWKELIR